MNHEQSGDVSYLAQLDLLCQFDTPTICNALERVFPERLSYGYTFETFVCAQPGLPPVIGYARTATIRSCQPSSRSPAEARAHRLQYLKYLAEGPKPFVVVIQDLDGPRAGYGSFWARSTRPCTKHSARWARSLTERCATLNGSPRVPASRSQSGTLDAFDHLVEFGGEVCVCGMVVRSGELVHFDRHGAVVVPAAAVSKLPAAAELIQRREAVILKACRRPDLNYDRLIEALAEADQIQS